MIFLVVVPMLLGFATYLSNNGSVIEVAGRKILMAQKKGI